MVTKGKTTAIAITAPKGFLRLKQIVGPGGPIPISPSCWWDWVKSGKAPRPVKLTDRATAWRVSDIEALIERLSKESGL